MEELEKIPKEEELEEKKRSNESNKNEKKDEEDDFWSKWELSKIKKHYEQKRRVRAKLTEQMNNAKTIEEKKIIMEILATLSSDDSSFKL